MTVGGTIARRVRLSTKVRPVLRDLLVGGAIIIGLWLTVVPPAPTGRMWQTVLAGLCLASVVSRTWIPAVAAVLAAVVTVLAWLTGVTADPCVMIGLCLFTVAQRRSARVFPWWLWGVSGLLGIVMLLIGGSNAQDGIRALVLSVIVLSSAWALGARSSQVRSEASARARAEERLRLAREVHDVLSHSLGTMGVQAGIAAHVSSLGEDELRQALREIAAEARTSLVELRELLRGERAEAVESPGAPLVVSINAMMRNLERAGIHVDAELSAELDDLPVVHQQTVRRVLQEAITNVIRHSGATRCAIAVRVNRNDVSVEVSDDGHGVGEHLREGTGLTGMRERAALLGGHVSIGDTDDGFALRAVVLLAGDEGP